MSQYADSHPWGQPELAVGGRRRCPRQSGAMSTRRGTWHGAPRVAHKKHNGALLRPLGVDGAAARLVHRQARPWRPGCAARQLAGSQRLHGRAVAVPSQLAPSQRQGSRVARVAPCQRPANGWAGQHYCSPPTWASREAQAVGAVRHARGVQPQGRRAHAPGQRHDGAQRLLSAVRSTATPRSGTNRSRRRTSATVAAMK